MISNSIKIIFLISLFLLIACKEEAPVELMPEDKLVKLIADAHLVEGALQVVFIDHKDSISNLYYEQLYTIHQTTEEEFQRNLEILKHDHLLAEKIYDLVVKDLTDRKVNR